MSTAPKELIVVRRLAQSDLGLFAVHREKIPSKQRAININAGIARQLLSLEAYTSGSVLLQCTCIYRGTVVLSPRLLRKSHKNWRLGGPRIEGAVFEKVRAGDYALLRSAEGNDGSRPIAVGFVTISQDPLCHAGLSKLLEHSLEDGMVAFPAGTLEYETYVNLCPRQFIAIRSLAESDLGVFSEHRTALSSKQRAFNINAAIARQMLDPAVYKHRGTTLRCICRHESRELRSDRPLLKVGKNWRLGGKKIDGKEFSRLDCKDFLLIRSVEWNDGAYRVALALVGKKPQRLIHAGLAKLIGERLRQSMAVVTEDDPVFVHLAKHCPAP